MNRFRFFPALLLGVLLLAPAASAQQRAETLSAASTVAVPPGYEHLLTTERPVRYRPDPQTGRLTLTPEGRAEAERLKAARPPAPRTAAQIAEDEAKQWTASARRTAPPISANSSATVITVNSAWGDPDNNVGDGICFTGFFGDECTIRAAIQEANAVAGTALVRIEFDIVYGPGGSEIAPGVWRIDVTRNSGGTDALPFVSRDNVTIDGLTQPGASCGDLVGGTPHRLKVILDGIATSSGRGLESSNSGFTVRGLVIQNFGFGYGIITFGFNTLVECNYVGTDYTGETAAGNFDGLYVTGTVRNNLVSGNGGFGIEMPPFPFLTVARNFVGTDDDGNQALGNSFTGILVRGDDATVTTNLVSANAFNGIELFSDIFANPAERAVLTNNTVGLTRLRADAGLGNDRFGIYVSFGASDNDIGLPGQGNFVGASFGAGIVVTGSGTNNNRIRGNTVGLTASGTAAPNYQGIFVGDAFGDGSPSGTVVGGTASGAGNVASGNSQFGISLFGATGTLAEGNTVGLNAGGTARPNNLGGVIFTGTTGGSTASGNTVSGNAGSGIIVTGASVIGAVIRENRIGTNAAGTAARPNGLSGVVLDGAFGVTVRGNTIAGNTDTGIFLDGGTSGHVFEDNFIGTNASGANLGNGLPGGNGLAGVYCQDAQDVRIGKNFSPNTIAHNGGDGIFLSPNCQSISVVGNVIHSNGGLAVDLAPNGVNPNDTGDGDTGANEKLNFPVLTSATNDGTNATLTWTLNARPNTTYELLFCRLPAPDPSGHGECEFPNALQTTTTNGSGNASGTKTLGAAAYPAGSWVSANATKAVGALPAGYGPTSEFSQARQVTDTSTPPGLFLTATNTSSLTVAPGGSVSFSYTIANNTAASVTGDLFFTAQRGSATVAQGVVVSGTLPAGQTVTSSFTQGVPGSAPPGSYTYTLRIGQFPSVTVDQVAFAVTVTGSARQGEAADSTAVWTLSEVMPWRPAEVADAAEAASRRGAEALPTEVMLAAAYPNPFARQTTLGFALPSSQKVTLLVFDVLGREVARLVDGEVEAGRHEAVLGGSGLPSGVYLVRLTAGGTTQTQRLTLLR